MAHNGKLFLDFTVPDPPKKKKHWTESDLRKMQVAVEKEIECKDHWNNGNCERNKWLMLFDVPHKHGKMRDYCNLKLKELERKHSISAVEDPPQPIAYCYSGDTRICYHPHALLEGKDLWIVSVKGVKGLKKKIEIVIVLSYETVCFPVK